MNIRQWVGWGSCILLAIISLLTAKDGWQPYIAAALVISSLSEGDSE